MADNRKNTIYADRDGTEWYIVRSHFTDYYWTGEDQAVHLPVPQKAGFTIHHSLRRPHTGQSGSLPTAIR